MLTSNGYVLDDSPRRLAPLTPVPASERSDRDALWARLRRDGYLYLTRALGPEDVLAFRRYYFEALAGTGLVSRHAVPGAGVSGDGAVDRANLRRVLFQDIVRGSEYARFCTQPAIREWYEWFLGGETHLHRRKILRHVQPGERGPSATWSCTRPTWCMPH